MKRSRNKIAKGGNDPLPLPLRLRLRWSFPPSECQEGNWARIEIDLHWISNGSRLALAKNHPRSPPYAI
jgi:hypothetical protein